MKIARLYFLSLCLAAIGVMVLAHTEFSRSASKCDHLLVEKNPVPQNHPIIATTPAKVLEEFEELGSGKEIGKDALMLQQEKNILFAGEPDLIQPTNKQGSHWADYEKLMAQIRANDLRVFTKEHDLHDLRFNDFIHRHSLCYSDFNACAKNYGQRDNLPVRAGVHEEQANEEPDERKRRQTLSVLIANEKKAQQNLELLLEAEKSLPR